MIEPSSKDDAQTFSAGSTKRDKMTVAQTHVSNWVKAECEKSNRPPVLMLSGGQGIGKTTIMKHLMQAQQFNLAVLGLDDFYLSASERSALAQSVHPLFETRGPPGTHHVGLLSETIDKLVVADKGSTTIWPHFDKKSDDVAPESDWRHFSGRPDAIIVEGWLIGVASDASAPNQPPINAVEDKDSDGVWREYQEDALATSYSDLWDKAASFFHLDAPDFGAILAWRIQQEEETQGVGGGELSQERQDWVKSFILYYERLTRRMLSNSRRPGHILKFNETRDPIAFQRFGD